MIRYISERLKYVKQNHFIILDNSDISIKILSVYPDYITIRNIVNYPRESKIWEVNLVKPKLINCEHTFRMPKDLNLFINSIRTRFRYHFEWVDFKKDLKTRLFLSRERYWYDVIPKDIVKWINAELDKLSENQNCVDNYRAAKAGNTCQEKRYKRSLDRGCCGFADFTVKCPIDGKMYKIGFNYGH